MIGTELVRRLAEVFREPLHEAQIVPDRSRRIVTTLEFLEQHLAKVGHSNVPPVTHTLSRPHNYSAATTVATAAPAASFSPATRKSVTSRPLKGDTPTIDLVLRYNSRTSR